MSDFNDTERLAKAAMEVGSEIVDKRWDAIFHVIFFGHQRVLASF
jgi:hypothetical protein